MGGALSGGLLVLLLARGSRSPVQAALIGAAVAALLGALVVGIISLAARTGDVQLFFLFTVGDLGGRTWSHLILITPWLLAAAPAAFLLTRPVALLGLGDDLAAGRGVPVAATRAASLITAAALVAPVVAVAGPIAWVGLLAPYAARLLIGPGSLARVLLLAAVLGALLLLAADVLARVLLAPGELPVGLMTTLLIAPPLLLRFRPLALGGAM